MGIMPFEEEMVERSVVHKIDEALQVRLPTPEDLIIMKAIGHHPKDLEDIRAIADKLPNLTSSEFNNRSSSSGKY